MGTVVKLGKNQHWAAFMYGRERQLLVHVVNNSKEGDAQSVLDAMDSFWGHHFGMKRTDTWSVRGDILDASVREKGAKRALELGTYCGYSALRIARSLPADGVLASVEIDPLFAAIATKIIEHAGLEHKVKVVTGTVEEKLDRITEVFFGSSETKEAIDFVLCDHDKERFVPDLELLETGNLAGPGTVIMTDTTTYPGEEKPDEGDNLLEYFVSSSKYRVQQHVGTDRGKAAGITVSEWQHMV
jgi:catechol O-methyltransferase